MTEPTTSFRNRTNYVARAVSSQSSAPTPPSHLGSQRERRDSRPSRRPPNESLMNDVNPNWTVGGFALIDGEVKYKIANSHEMAELLMSLDGSSDQWM